jgi:hypothetical protein
MYSSNVTKPKKDVGNNKTAQKHHRMTIKVRIYIYIYKQDEPFHHLCIRMFFTHRSMGTGGPAMVPVVPPPIPMASVAAQAERWKKRK